MTMSANHPTAHVPAMTIGYGLRAAAARQPSKIALTDHDGRARTYRDFIANVNRVANYVSTGLGLGRGDHSALMSTNSIEFIEITIGLSEACVPAAMINPSSTPDEVAYICNDSQARILFIQKEFEEIVRAADLPSVEHIIVIEHDLPNILSSASEAELELDLTAEDIYTIPYTSGTTGKPKGVLLSHRSRVMMMLFAQAGSYGVYNSECRGLAMSPFYNGGGLSNAICPIFFGGSCHILPRFMAKPMLDAIQERRITNMFVVPTQFHALFKLGDEALEKYDRSSLKLINCSAAALPQATKEKVVEYFGPDVLFDAYGSTEFGSATVLRPTDQLRKLSCVGLPQPGVQLKLLADDGTEVATGEVGEVCVKSPWLCSGYWNRPEETSALMKKGWMTVGDLGRRDEEGYLYIVDRKKNVIISGGQNIFPGEVEDTLYHHPGIHQVAIVGKPDDYWGESVVAFIVPEKGASLSPDELKTYCKERLSGYKVPKEYFFRDELPKNGTGKIMHRALKDELVRAK